MKSYWLCWLLVVFGDMSVRVGRVDCWLCSVTREVVLGVLVVDCVS